MSLRDDVIDAHGGLTRWRATSRITLHLSSGGLAFASKGQRRALHDLTATVSTEDQSVRLDGGGWTESFDSGIPAASGLLWSRRDVAAFAASALWTYVSLPFILPQLVVTEVRNTLDVRFPSHLRTHSPRQVLHIGSDGLIRRHDYTALDFGRWASASQVVSGYHEVDGLKFATRRRVRPRRWPHRPELVWIDVHHIETVPRLGADTGCQRR